MLWPFLGYLLGNCLKPVSVRGLRLPRWKATLVGKAGSWMIFAGLVLLFLTAMVAPTLSPTGVLVGVVGFGLTWIDLGRLPADCRTLGGLVRKVAGLNFGDLYTQGAKPRDKDLWNTLLGVLSEYTFLPRAEIHPGTLILHKQLQSACSSPATPDRGYVLIEVAGTFSHSVVQMTGDAMPSTCIDCGSDRSNPLQ